MAAKDAANHCRYHESIDNLTPADEDKVAQRAMTMVLESTLDAARQSCCREKGSNARPSHNAACSANGKPRNVINQTSQSLP